MSNVGTVSFDIAAESAKLRQELDKVRKDVSGLKDTGVKMSKAMESAFAGVQQIAGAAGLTLGIAAITTGFINATKAAIEYGDAIGKASTKAGIGTAEFQGLAYAAKKVDVDMGALSTSLRVMQTNLSEAASGSKSSAAALEALGLKAGDLKRMAPEEQFQTIAQQISQLTDPADRARAATELFGRAGADLLPMFEQGAAGIRSAVSEAQKLNLIMTPDQLKQLQEADDAVKELGNAWDGLAKTLTAKVAPALTWIMEKLAEQISGSNSVDVLKQELIDLQRQMAWLPGANNEGTKSIIAKRIADVTAAIAAKGGKLEQGGSGPAGRGAHDFGGPLPPGFGTGGGGGSGGPDSGPSAAMTEFLGRGRDDRSSSANGIAGRMVMRNGKLVPESEAQSSEFDMQAQQMQLAAIEAFNQQKLDLEDKYNADFLERNQIRETSILDMFHETAEQRQIIEAATQENIGGLAQMGMSVALDAMGRQSKAGKAIAIADATIHALVAANKALAAGSPPWNFIAAAAVLASGLQTVARIKSTNPGGGGGGGGSVGAAPSSVGGAGTADGISKQASEPEAKARPTVQFIVNGDVHSGKETADWLFDTIRERLETTDATIIPIGSRQELDLLQARG